MKDNINCYIGASNFEVKAFAVIGPLDTDDAEKRTYLQQQWFEVEDLIKKGLAEDISSKFPQNIESMKVQTGRDTKIITLTKIGHLMFEGCDGRAVN